MRVVGKRKEGSGDRDGLDALVLKFGGGAEKGVFRYRTQEECQPGLGSMDQRTRAATYQDLLRVAALLEEEQVEYALIGGYALALQGIVRLTEDVDIMVEPSVAAAR